jgi:hypothetical protein
VCAQCREQYAPLPWFSGMSVKANACSPPITTNAHNREDQWYQLLHPTVNWQALCHPAELIYQPAHQALHKRCARFAADVA